MDDLNDASEDSVNILFANVYMKMMFIYVILMLIAFAMIQPIIEKQEHKSEGIVSPAGNIMVEIFWPDKVNVDIDLWVQSPDDERPVGYSNLGGKTFNLLRDDLGTTNDASEKNYESAYGRGLPEGEYTVNLHFFANYENLAEVPVKVIISTAQDGGHMRQIIVRNVTLKNVGEEVTVVRFTLNKDGDYVPGSDHDLFKELRSWNPSLAP